MSSGLTFYSRSSFKTATTSGTFAQFRQQWVDLDPEEVKTARKSRDYLQGQIQAIADKDATFPRLSGGHIDFGSFARSTKVRPLDDIDMLSLLNGRGTQEEQIWCEQYTHNLRIIDVSAPLAHFADSDGLVNSTRILNRFKSDLQNVPNYQKAEIKRTGVAVVLNLSSYPWRFDIVPAVPIADSNRNTVYYLIPNGAGKWTRTDPRRDQAAISRANQQQNNNLIPLIRLVKYWNSYSYSAPQIGSYYLETMLINGIRNCYSPIVATLRPSVPLAFRTLASQIYSAEMKGTQSRKISKGAKVR